MRKIEMEYPNQDMNSKSMASSVGPQTLKAPAPDRQIDKYFMASEEQVLFLVRQMRRVEELADRLSGSVPTGESATRGENPHEPGIFGGLISQNNDRETALHRLSDALDRIEQVL
jgi:hypothetical protein